MRRSWVAVAAAAVLICSCGDDDRAGNPFPPTSTGIRPPGPLPPPPPPPSSTQAAIQEIDAILKGLPLAAVAFNAPKSLRLGEPQEIELLLSMKDPIADLKDKVNEAGERIGAVIRISDRMEAHLTGSGFKIEAVTPEVQSVSSSDITAWKWDVEATETGRQRLHLTLNAILDVRGTSSERTVRTFERTVAIDVSLSARMITFVQDNWQWLWTAILFPVAAWYLGRRKKEGSPRKKKARRRPAS